MVALIALWFSISCFATWVFLLLPVGSTSLEILEDNASFVSAAYSGLILNISAAAYLIYFFVKLGMPDAFWLFCSFVGLGLLCGGSLSLSLQSGFSIPAGQMFEIAIGGSWQENVAIVIVGGLFAFHSARRYEKSRLESIAKK